MSLRGFLSMPVRGAMVLLPLVLIQAACVPAVRDPGAATAALECARAADARYQPQSGQQGATAALAELLDALADRRVVLVGEHHDRLDHHLHQLAVICAMAAGPQPIAIGLEAFQTPYQRHLDDYVAGRIDETTLLERTEYYQRWRYDFRLYAPILRHARENGLQLLALNAPAELTRAVGRVGVDGLDAEQRAGLPDELAPAGSAYRARLQAVFAQHPGHGERDFEHFLDVQRVWDESMAERAAHFLQANPGHRLVVLAGVGHVAPPDAIAAGLLRRKPVPLAVLVPDAGDDLPGGLQPSYHTLSAAPLELQPPGRLGVFLDDAGDGVRVAGFADDSPAREAGVREGDRITRINGRDIGAFADVKLALWQALPGEQASVRLLRGGDGATGSVELVVSLR